MKCAATWVLTRIMLDDYSNVDKIWFVLIAATLPVTANIIVGKLLCFKYKSDYITYVFLCSIFLFDSI